MLEIANILNAYNKATSLGKRSALATVVHVEGSSYRRPGARMLVTDHGQLTGAISGGCLEGDALRKALLAIAQGQNKLVTYDTTNEDDAQFGVQLGCNGIVYILFEPISELNKANPIHLLSQLVAKRKSAVLVTLFSLAGSSQPGTSLLFRKEAVETSLAGSVKELITPDAQQVFEDALSTVKTYHLNEQVLNGFIEFIPPPVAVVIAGAGNDVQPLVHMTAILGWHTTVVDGRHTHATKQRFPTANKVLVAKPGEVLDQVDVDDQTVFLLMTHNYNYDLALLQELLKRHCRYIGILGPKKKLERMLTDLQTEGILLNEQQRACIHSPVGLDIGAETPEEIALSIIAEIKAVLSARGGSSLKDKTDTIHQRPPHQRLT
ncbi:MAG: XdhC/CoxI family protein [Chitinophagaceae bacterium]